jgi:hypothetical protein
MSLRMPTIVDVSACERRGVKMMPGIINIEAMTTLTGEQKAMMDGIVVETRPSHKLHAPGLPAGGDELPPMMRVKPSPSQSAMGMRKIRGTVY